MIEKNVSHLIFGAGLIGGYLAGALLSKDQNVTLVGREKSRGALKDGLTISDYTGYQKQISPPIFISAENRGGPDDADFDIIWLTLKCTSIVNAIASIKNIVSANSIIICCQNGLGSDQIVRGAFPNNVVVSAVVGYNVVELKAGHLHRATEGQLIIQSTPFINSVVDVINCACLPISTSSDIVSQQWAKLELNLANAVNALADIPVKAMTEEFGFRKIIASLMREFLLVSNAKGLTLPKTTAVPAHWIPTVLCLPNFLFKVIAQKMLAIDPTARTSMWHDLFNGRLTEIDFLNGALIKTANSMQIDCPVNAALIKLIHQVETGEEKIGFTSKQLTDKLIGHSQ